MAKNPDWLVRDRLQHVEYESMSFSKTLLAGLDELRREDKFVDVTLVAQGELFKVHRAVLAACSPFFKALFAGSMKEAGQNKIHLKEITAQGLKMLINYAYTCKLELNRSNVTDALSAANYAQIPLVIWWCADYLETQIDLVNCVDIASIAQLYSLAKVKDKTSQFICAHLEEFSSTGELNSLTWEQLEDVLSSGFPMHCNESTVLRIVLKWISNHEVDENAAYRLIDQIFFNEIKPTVLDEIISEARKDEHKHYDSLARRVALIKPFEYFDIARARFEAWDEILVNLRGMEKALFTIGGFEPTGVTNHISYYLPSRKKWYQYTVIPHVEQSSYGTAVVGNDLFTVGGCYDACLREYIHPFGFRFSPTKNRWKTMEPMQQDRCRFSLNAVGNYLYAICGANTEPEDALSQEVVPPSNCERYNVKTDKWDYIPALPENRSQHAGASHESFVYISGGLDKNIVLASLWRYDTNTFQWQELAPMLRPRADHALLPIDGKLYACGGWYEDQVPSNRTLSTTIDVYDIATDTWSIETTFSEPRFHPGIGALNDKIYIIGGLYDSREERNVSSMNCYDTKTKTWIEHDDFPQYLWECTCVALYVPRFREDMELTPVNYYYNKQEPTNLKQLVDIAVANYMNRDDD